ncbi:MAG TPA: dephospho-CoA kinase [Rhodothermales bacterium]|nr:dephospho-CoA kinase [Rhodothermales bacterium]
MLTLGVTGGIGAGKTTVCRVLERLGARVFYADVEAKRLMEDDPALRKELAEAFGPATYDATGRLDRASLAAQVFGHPERLARLNALVHPRVFEAWAAFRAQAETDGVPLVVHEAALLFEAGGERHVDAVLVVDAPLDVRLARAAARDHTSLDFVRARAVHQTPGEDLRRRATYVIFNDGDADRLEREVRALYARLTSTPSTHAS